MYFYSIPLCARVQYMKKKRVFSGIQPSGIPHIGNYLGAMKRWANSDDKNDNIFFVVDLHAITLPKDPETLHRETREMVGTLIASGIDPDKSTIFVQSHISAHSELAWILNCITPISWLDRMTQFKEKSKRTGASVGLFDYPVLMAADILLYDVDEIPVGEDQKQHVELARQIAKSFNSKFGDTFKIPKEILPEVGARIMSLSSPEQKMSKSDPDQSGCIYVIDSPKEIEKKIGRATTDSESVVDLKNPSPGIKNLLTIYELVSGKKEDVEGKSYSEFKKELTLLVVKELEPVRKKYKEVTKDPSYIESVLKKGADRLRPIAEAKLREVQKKLGLG